MSERRESSFAALAITAGASPAAAAVRRKLLRDVIRWRPSAPGTHYKPARQQILARWRLTVSPNISEFRRATDQARLLYTSDYREQPCRSRVVDRNRKE